MNSINIIPSVIIVYITVMKAAGGKCIVNTMDITKMNGAWLANNVT